MAIFEVTVEKTITATVPVEAASTADAAARVWEVPQFPQEMCGSCIDSDWETTTVKEAG